jgi:NitT/TauT family transport system substrate-binding protein
MKTGALLLAAIFCFTAAGAAPAAEYTVATVAWMGWSPLHVAEAKGFWENRSLSVRVVNYDDPIVILEAIKAGRIDFAMDMIGSLAGIYMEGAPVVALAETNWSHGGDKIVIKKGTHLRQHLGEPLGVFLNLPSCLYFLGRYLEEQDLSLSDFRVVEIAAEDLAAQFIAGRIPAILDYDPWVLRAIEKGNGQVLATSADFDGCIPEGLWGYRTHLAAIPPDHIVKLLLGWIDAVVWLHDPAHWREYSDILNTRTFQSLPDYDGETIRRMRDNVRIHLPPDLRHRNRTGGGLEGYLRSLRAFLDRNGLLKRAFGPDDLFDNRYILDALDIHRNTAPPASGPEG